ARIFDREEELTRGDLVMAVKNNYYWAEKLARSLPKEERLPFDFIANGDVAEVVQIRGVHTLYGFRFADATLRFPDYDDYELTCRVLLSTLTSESPSLTPEESRRLFDEVEADYADIPQRKERMKRLRQDPYYNALQIKYAYAVTCHKAQGGQWQRVFIDQGYVTPEMGDASYLRWLYTAYTRTTDRLYLVNWPEEQREVE
ncbi:MAG: ATP-binding domain-containing protein, partial [Bacteroidaceae bacterium]|nr:ATP-binding domain-containing protein [Bacteroidaceae bacterium]